MMALRLAVAPDFRQVLPQMLAGLRSEHSRRSYERAVKGFLVWLQDHQEPVTPTSFARYRDHLTAIKLAPASVALIVHAIRSFARTAAEIGLIGQPTYQALRLVRAPRLLGTRAGRWLLTAEVTRLMLAPPGGSLRGLLDRAILACLFAGALRRGECAALTCGQLTVREGRPLLVDIRGKGGRVRSVPLPPWADLRLRTWLQAAARCFHLRRVESEFPAAAAPLFLRVLGSQGRYQHPVWLPLSSEAVYQVVRRAADRCGFVLAPHDLRRTFAKLALKGGAGLDQVAVVMGHASVATTERYAGGGLDLDRSPCDTLRNPDLEPGPPGGGS